jgi:ECF sigma factor
MANYSIGDTTYLLRAWASGDSGALEQLTPRVYRELRRMAARRLQNERPGYSCVQRNSISVKSVPMPEN